MNVRSCARTLLILLIVCFAFPAIADVHGVLRVVKGDVQIKSAQTGQISKAKLGQEVYPKDSIITGKDARAKIVMIDNNEINVSPDSHIEIQNYEFNPAQNKKDVLLNVLYGKVRSKVEQKYDGKTSKFEVKTPSAVAGVRGTDFAASYDSGTKSTQIVTFRGAVQFGLPGPNGSIANSVSVTPGKMASSVAGAAPAAPTVVPKAQLAKMDEDSKAEGGSKDSREPSSDKKGHDGDHHNSNGNGNSGSNNSGNSGNNSSSSGNQSNSSSGNASSGSNQSGGSANAGSASSSSGASGASNNSGGAGSGPQQSSAAAPAPSAPAGGDSAAPAAASAPAAGASSSQGGGGGDQASAPAAASAGGGGSGSSDSSSNGSSGSSSGSSGGDRAPASAAPAAAAPAPSAPAASGSMIQTGDLAGSANTNMPDIPKTAGASMPTVGPPPTTAPANTNPMANCPLCQQVIQNGTSKLTITVK